MTISKSDRKTLLKAQQGELDAVLMYNALADTVREWAELGILGAIIVLRGLLTFLIHWEIENERKAMEKESR